MDEIIEIRPMRVGDSDAVAAMEQAIFTNPWSKDSIREVLEKKTAIRGLVGEVEKCMAGYAFYWIAADEMHIANIAIDEKYRRRGYGEKMLERMLSDGLNNGVRFAVLEVRESNLPAIKMYEKHGFGIEGVRRNYYTDNGENALIMTAEIKE